MAEVVQREEQKLIEFSVKQKVELEEELREAAKSRLLTENSISFCSSL